MLGTIQKKQLIKPNFFIVGAPKCGTSSISFYLNQHPDVFMAKTELHFFGKDLHEKNKISEADYLTHFQKSSHKKIIGDKSVWYLYSKTAAKEIRSYSPNAKILIMLRNPVTFLQSLHSQNIYDCNEDVIDFQTAISLDEERKKGLQLPNAVDYYILPSYLDAALFSEQIQRYLTNFGKENVHILILEEFKKDAKKGTESVLEFLGLIKDESIMYPIINENKKLRSISLHRFIKMPKKWQKKTIRILIPFKPIRHYIMSTILKKNKKVEPRKAISSELSSRLKMFYEEEIKKIETVIGREIPDWHN